jgi:hypothetical protein
MARQPVPASECTHSFTGDARSVNGSAGARDASRTTSTDQRPFPGGSSSR